MRRRTGSPAIYLPGRGLSGGARMGFVIVDLSHPISAGMQTYPGLDPPRLRTVISRTASAQRLGSGVGFEIEALTLVGTTGTYLDAPFHFHADRPDIAEVPLQRLVNVPIMMIRAVGVTAVGADHFGDPSRLCGAAVLVQTGWSRHWGTPRYLEFDNPFLTPDAVDLLIAANVAVVGVDSLNIDNPSDPRRPAKHTRACSVPTSRSLSTSPTSTPFPTMAPD